jgi:hypothetical protein
MMMFIAYLPSFLFTRRFTTHFWRWGSMRNTSLFEYRSQEPESKDLQHGGGEEYEFLLDVSSYLVFCFPASKAWDLQAGIFSVVSFSALRTDHKLGWASFPLLHAMHCKYGFMRICGRMEGQMVGGVFTRLILHF